MKQQGTGLADTLIGDLLNNLLRGRAGNDTLLGDAGDDTLFGGSGSDTLEGEAGEDTLKGSSGNDTLSGGEGDDTLKGGSSNDALAGDSGNDKLNGGSGKDVLAGGNGSDDLDGAKGDDTLNGGSGSDILTGGQGRDRFLFNGDPFDGTDVSSPGRDIVAAEDAITDFSIATDQFVLDADDFQTSGEVSFFNGLAADLPAGGVNVIVLQDSDNDDDPDTPFLAGTAANLIAEKITEPGAGFFVYFNSELDINRLVYSTDLSNAEADLKIVARLTNRTGNQAIQELSKFTADNFDFIGDGIDDDGVILGTEDDDIIEGTDDDDVIDALQGDDVITGRGGSDTITGGDGADAFTFEGDPFDGVDVSAPERDIVANEDFITDFDFAQDTYRLNTTDFDVIGDVSFAALDANAEDAVIEAGTNVVVLLNSDNDDDPETPFLAGTAANQIAELTEEDGAGFFIYFNSELQLNRLAYSTNLNDANADLKIISRQTDLLGQEAIDALASFTADNFEFEAIQDNGVILGTDDDDVIEGTEDDDVIDALGGDDVITGRGGSDTITGGDGADAFAFEGDPFDGVDVSAPERDIVANEDFITDFDFAQDTYRLNATDFDVIGDVSFAALNANAEDAAIEAGTNVVVLLNSDNDDDPETPFLAGTAANQIAELTEEDGAGFFVYFNSELQLNRLAYSTNLNDTDADLKIISRQTDLLGQEAIDALDDFTADNFEFEAIQDDENDESDDGELIFGDDNDNVLEGTAGDDILDGRDGQDRLTGGAGRDAFQFSSNYFAGIEIDVDEQDFSAQESDTITDFNPAEDRLLFSPDQFSLDSLRFANQAAGDSLVGANVVVLAEPERTVADAFSEVRSSGGDTNEGMVIFADVLPGNSGDVEIKAVQYANIDRFLRGQGGQVTVFENLTTDDLASLTADNFAFSSGSENMAI